MAAKKTTKKPATKQTTASTAGKVPTSAELAAIVTARNPCYLWPSLRPASVMAIKSGAAVGLIA